MARPLVDYTSEFANDPLNTARVRVLNGYTGTSTLYPRGWTSECYRCLRPLLRPNKPGLDQGGFVDYFRVDTDHGWTLEVLTTKEDITWDTQEQLNQRHIDAVETLLRTANLNDVSETESLVSSDSDLFTQTYDLTNKGVYTLVLQNPPGKEMESVRAEDHPGTRTWVPLIVGLFILIFVALAYLTVLHILRKRGILVKPDASPAGKRLVSVDTLRGLSLAIMVFVNYGGGQYWFFDHSIWDGLTVADLVFPWFVFVMGTSMHISLSSLRDKSIPKVEITKKVLWRTIRLFALGVFLNDGRVLKHWRIPGVLQYFAFAHLVVGLVDIWLPPIQLKGAQAGSVENQRLLGNSNGKEQAATTAETVGPTVTPYQVLWNMVSYWPQLAVVFGLMIVYLLCQYVVDVPGCPKGYIGPGGLSEFGRHKGCVGGAHRFIDRKLFGFHHIFHSLEDGKIGSAATCAGVYQCGVYDPEGTLGAITCAVLAYFGIIAGRVLKASTVLPNSLDDGSSSSLNTDGARTRMVQKLAHSKVFQLCCLGAFFGLIGGGLSGMSKHGGPIPLSKNLWSPSFIAVQAGTAYLLLALLYVCCDSSRFWNGSPFTYMGMNSVLVYVGHAILGHYFPFMMIWHTPLDHQHIQYKSHAVSSRT